MHVFRFGNLVIDVINNLNAAKIQEGTVSKKAQLDWHDELTRQEFRAVLTKIDSGLRALPATAQVGHFCHGIPAVCTRAVLCKAVMWLALAVLLLCVMLGAPEHGRWLLTAASGPVCVVCRLLPSRALTWPSC